MKDSRASSKSRAAPGKTPSRAAAQRGAAALPAPLENPLAPPQKAPALEHPDAGGAAGGIYEESLAEGYALRLRPRQAAPASIIRQHQKKRMTVWERIATLSKRPPTFLFQNLGPELDGASLVAALGYVGRREVAIYGHDFTVRAGSVDAGNGKKLARLFELAHRRGIPVVGMNDSAGAYVPAGVGGLDGYAEAFTALRRMSGVVPSLMCMFGFNAGGGSYLPRQGSFVIQPENTFFGLTGPGVVKSVLQEEITAEELGGPGVHSRSGVTDLQARDETHALDLLTQLLAYLPNNNSTAAARSSCSDPTDRATWDIDLLLRKAFNSPSGFSTPFPMDIVIQQLCDHGDYLELQPQRARNMLTIFGRMAGHVVGFVANNSAVTSGQIDIHAAYKGARFIRFCNIYNIPLIFLEDTTGFLPGKEQEHDGIVQAGRALLDSIIDVRTPRFLVLIRNAFGGAYASFNNYATGADLVLALPSARLAVMGTAGMEFVYKKELRALRASLPERTEELARREGKGADAARQQAQLWLQGEEARLAARYEREFLNPREALGLGSISQIVLPWELRSVLCENLCFHMEHYKAAPLGSVQREFH